MRSGVLMVLVLLGCAAGAAAQAASGPDDVQVVRATGYASIYEGDEARARDEAIADARVRALESLGFYLEGQTTLSRGRLLDRTIQERTKGYIVAERVMEEGPRPDVIGMYQVEIEAWVKLALSDEERRKYKRKFSIVLDIPHLVLHDGESTGESMRRRGVEHALRDALIDEGFEVYNREQLSRIQQVDELLGRVYKRDPDAIRVVTDYAMAEMVVTGRVDVEFSSVGPETDMYGLGRGRSHYYKAFPNVFAMEGETAREVASYSTDEGIRGAQLSARKAAQKAASNATEPVVQEILKGLRRYAGSDRITVTVVISGLPDLSKYGIYERLLKGLRWVEAVEAGAFEQSGGSTYRVTFKERFSFLLRQMDRLPGLDEIEGGNLRISASYSGLPGAR